MKKKIALMCVVILSVMSISQSIGAINVIMNSSFVKFPDQEPVIENGTTLVPIRPIAEALGLEVGWDDPTDTVTLKKDNFYVELVIGSTTAKTSSGTKTLLSAPQIINKRTMVPLRFIAEELGLKVSWNDQYKRVVIAGEVDTTVAEPKVEEFATDTEEPMENATDTSAADIQPVEEETEEIIEEAMVMMAQSRNSNIIIEIPLSYNMEDTSDEASFASRAIDALDIAHTYDWEKKVTFYESYADESGANGIIVVVQDFGTMEVEEYNVSRINDEYPEKPERYSLDWDYYYAERERLLKLQLIEEQGLEMPENYDSMSETEQLEYVGFESENAFSEFVGEYDFSSINEMIPEYVEYQIYKEANDFYLSEYIEITVSKAIAQYYFNQAYANAGDDEWVTFFTALFNSDEEVRFENVEVVDFNDHRAIHATIYAEDPDDEQGVFDYYHYIEDGCIVTIFGGTLFGAEAASEAVNALANMEIN